MRPDDSQVAAALADFTGDIAQVPPKFSAVKVDGKRAYALSRSGADVTLEPRPLYVDELSFIERPDADHITLHMVCGKGGYVRSIARDLGQALGCLGHVRSLRRVWSGPFELDDAVTLDRIDELAKSPELDQLLLPLEVGLSDLPELATTQDGALKMRNGNPGIVMVGDVAYGDEAWASLDGQAVAVGRYKGGELHPSRVFSLDN